MQLQRWRSLIIGVVLVGGVIWYYGAALWFSVRDFVLPFVCFVLGYAVCVSFTQIAYLVGGRACGYRFCEASMGPVQFVREMEGVRLRRNPERLQIRVVMLPIDLYRLRRRTMYLLWVGPIASLVLAFISIGVLFAIPFAMSRMVNGFGIFVTTAPLPIPQGKSFIPFVGVLSISAFFYFGLIAGSTALFGALQFVNAFVGRQGVASTWQWWRTLSANRGEARRYLAMLVLSGNSLSGMRPREWDSALVAAAIEPLSAEDSVPLDSALYAYWYALDRRDIAEMMRWIDDLSARLGGPLPAHYAATIRCEAAYYSAWYLGDVVAARAQLPEVATVILGQHRLARAEAAVLLAEGRRKESWIRATEGIALLARANNLGIAHMDAELLNAIMARTMDPQIPSDDIDV